MCIDSPRIISTCPPSPPTSPLRIYYVYLLRIPLFLSHCAAFYIPPKLEQATIHGGTFVLSRRGTSSSIGLVFAHYDESPGTHADPSVVVDIAIREATATA